MYNSLADIQSEKEKLHDSIAKKEAEIGELWNQIFHEKEEPLFETPTQRLMKFAHTGAGLLDGALLGWKLYRKVNGFSFGRKKRK